MGGCERGRREGEGKGKGEFAVWLLRIFKIGFRWATSTSGLALMASLHEGEH